MNSSAANALAFSADLVNAAAEFSIVSEIESIAASGLAPAVFLCLASVIFLVVCLRKYFVSRALEMRMPESIPATHRIESQDVSVSAQRDDGIDGGMASIGQRWSAPPLADIPTYVGSEEDQRQGLPAEALIRMQETLDVREAIGARVALHRTSAQGLSDLVRALYLDQSNFRFHVIAELAPQDRELARALIEKWMADPTATEYWEETYASVCSNPDTLRADPGELLGEQPRG